MAFHLFIYFWFLISTVFMCIYLLYHINKQRDASFEFSSILSTVDLSKHLITASTIQKFIQLVNFVANNDANYVFLILLRQSSMVKPVWAGAFEKWKTSIITGSFYKKNQQQQQKQQQQSCANLFNVEHFCDKILSTWVRIQKITNLRRCNQPWNGFQRQMFQNPGGGRILLYEKVDKFSSSLVQFKDSGLT